MGPAKPPHQLARTPARHCARGLLLVSLLLNSWCASARGTAEALAPNAHPRLDRSAFTSSGAFHSGHNLHSHRLLVAQSSALKNIFIGKCVGVVDGDTIYVEHDGQLDKIDLWGIDCPELGQPCGLQARQYTINKVLNQAVRVHIKGHTPGGRLLGWIDTVGGGTLNEDLVGSGLAWWASKIARDEVLLPLLEDTARQDKRGLWADKDPIPPAKWRKTHGE